MKKLIIFALTMLLGSALVAQVQPVIGDGILYSQMWNMSNTYYNTVIFNPNLSTYNLGSQLDTTSNTTPLYVQTATWKAGAVATDTCFPTPVNGCGSISINWSVLKCTGTNTVTLTLYESPNGINWYPVLTDGVGTSISAQVCTPTSLTVAVTGGWDLALKLGRYYKVGAVGLGSTTSSLQVWFYYQRKEEKMLR